MWTGLAYPTEFHLTPVRVDDTLLMPGLVDTHHHLTQSQSSPDRVPGGLVMPRWRIAAGSLAPLVATAIGGMKRVDRMKNIRSSLSRILKRENA